MKKISFLVSMIILFSCNKYNENVNIDTVLTLGQSDFYINGQKQNNSWENSFEWFGNSIDLSLSKKEKNDLIYNSFFFLNFDYKKKGTHPIQENSLIKNEGVYVGFEQIVDEDLFGFKYELQTNEDNYFEIISVDNVKKTIEFKFRIFFKRKSKNENIYSTDEEWPKYLKLEGHFFDFYK